MEICETVKIRDDSAPGGYVVINKEDYDESRHTLFVEARQGIPAPVVAPIPDELSEAAHLSTGRGKPRKQ
jgi:hypothetical protein